MSATINEGKITAVALRALQERDRELWLWLTGMRRHILVFELVAKAGRSSEEGVSGQLNKTRVDVNLNIGWRTLRQPDGLWHRRLDQMKNTINNNTLLLSVTPHPPGYTYT